MAVYIGDHPHPSPEHGLTYARYPFDKYVTSGKQGCHTQLYHLIFPNDNLFYVGDYLGTDFSASFKVIIVHVYGLLRQIQVHYTWL